MMETLSTLFVFIIIITLALIVYGSISKSSLEQKQDEFAELRDAQIAQISSSLPEFQCSSLNILDEVCYDVLKLDAASQIQKSYYFDLFGYSTLTIQEIYPSQREWLIYNAPLQDYQQKKATFHPISLYDPIGNTNAFGHIKIEVYS